MSKYFPPGLCAHCLNHFENLTSDHVLPESWYPKGIPVEFEKWQMPSCIDCNKKYSIIEEDLLTRIGLLLDNDKLESKGIRDKVIRSMKPNVGKSTKDKACRERKRKKFLSELFPIKENMLQSVIPGFGIEPNYQLSELQAIPVYQETITKITEKLVKGMTYIFNNAFINDEYLIDFDFFEKETEEYFEKLLSFDSKEYNCGPALYIKRRVAIDDDVSSLYKIILWGRLKLIGWVTRKEDETV